MCGAAFIASTGVWSLLVELALARGAAGARCNGSGEARQAGTRRRTGQREERDHDFSIRVSARWSGIDTNSSAMQCDISQTMLSVHRRIPPPGHLSHCQLDPTAQ